MSSHVSFHSLPDDDPLLVVERIARAAGKKIEDVAARARQNPEEKAGGQGPVTEADLVADVWIRTELGRAFPDDVLISEETWVTGASVDAHPRVWFIDPLDGTREFIAGNNEYAVMIGLVVDGAPTLGVVHQSSTGVSWVGDVERRLAFRIDASGVHQAVSALGRSVAENNDDRTQNNDDSDDNASENADFVVAISRSHKSDVALFVSRALNARVVECGSVGVKVGLVVDGLADVYLSGSRRIKVWDTAGPAAIAIAAGGAFTAVDGTPLSWVGPAAHGAGVRAMTASAAKNYGARIDALIDAVVNGDASFSA